MFKIREHHTSAFFTTYTVLYKGSVYTCKYNGGLPKLQGLTLSEKLRCDLAEVLENYFLNIQCK